MLETLTGDKIEPDPNILSNIVFSYQATFYLNGIINRNNCRFWTRGSPQWVHELHT